ncbi:MAG TPA: hypothetical protein ENJ88_06680 [Phaeodactylibacter sp.]|nr:hypothetical protein [Phaeodactylibacter sp.]
MQQIAEEDKALQEAIREIKKQKKLEEARIAAAAAREKREQLRRQVAESRKKILEKTRKELEDRPIRIGDKVALIEGDATGTVEAIGKNKLTLQMGLLRMEVPITDVVLVESAQPQKTSGAAPPHVKKVTGKIDLPPEIDVRGLTAREAEQELEVYLDRALLDNLSRFRIIHGKGQGILRKAVNKWLREQTQIRDYFQPDGNTGVTEVVL